MGTVPLMRKNRDDAREIRIIGKISIDAFILQSAALMTKIRKKLIARSMGDAWLVHGLVC